MTHLIALDIDGTVLTEAGELLDEVKFEIGRVVASGNEVMLATGRSVAMTLPIVDRLGIAPQYVVCSNGAITLRRGADGYERAFVETFSPREVLTTIRSYLAEANYGVEDEEGVYRYHGTFPAGVLGATSKRVEFDELLDVIATRVVVISPGTAIDDFLDVVEKMGLHKVSYNVGWTAWLDIAPDGVNKSTAMERVRSLLDIPIDDVIAIGDGRNDIEMLQWAGRGVAMGQAPDEVKAVASEVTGSDLDGGVAQVLAEL